MFSYPPTGSRPLATQSLQPEKVSSGHSQPTGQGSSCESDLLPEYIFLLSTF